MRLGYIEIKSAFILKGLMENKFDQVLVDIILYIADTYGLVMTESFRYKEHINDLHGEDPVRAVDLRFTCYGDDQSAYNIMHDINSKWAYDTDRPNKKCAVVHNSGRGIHFHIQVHPNTKERTR